MGVDAAIVAVIGGEQHALGALMVTAVTVGVLHTVMGPDHYLPFVAMSRAGGWSVRKTLLVTLVCGVGHVAGSVALGLVGIAIGMAVGGLELLESVRSSVAGWLLIGFGLAYMSWGIRRALRDRRHAHWHDHADGTVHSHDHHHHGDHAHVHTDPAKINNMTPWVLFTLFVFGPCESLIPLLMYPAAEMNGWSVFLVTLAFASATLLTMVTAVWMCVVGMARFSFDRGFGRYAHALAGLAVAGCGVTIQLGL